MRGMKGWALRLEIVDAFTPEQIKAKTGGRGKHTTGKPGFGKDYLCGYGIYT